jgi:serine/threonine-protein kinase HipA
MAVGETEMADVWLATGSGDREVGRIFVRSRRGATSSVFNYSPSYLDYSDCFDLSPELPRVDRATAVSGLPGPLADSAPDRWGRHLIDVSRREERRSFVSELDYLLGVSDVTRHGALRFTRGDGEFLGLGTSVPLMMDLPKLLDAADTVARMGHSGDEWAAVKYLLTAGSSSLGGARPKATVRIGQTLYIAKFPHPHDEWDVMGWEKTALDLAELCGASVPRRQLHMVGGRHVLLVERFDRDGRQRIPYLSAMSLLQARDGASRDYLDIAESFSRWGHNVGANLTELWRRMAFSIAINNVDDHLRNHGFLRGERGWELSPLFDVNPYPSWDVSRSTSIASSQSADTDVDGLMAAASYCGLSPSQAVALWDHVRHGLSEWRTVANRNDISASEVQRFASIFDRYCY